MLRDQSIRSLRAPAVLASVLTFFTVLLGSASASQATTYTITDTRDQVAADLSCTLREALMAVRDRVAVDTCAAGTVSNTINLGFGTYTFDQGTFNVPASADLLDLEIIGLNGILVATRIELGGSNAFITVDGVDFGTEVAHQLRIANVQIQNGAATSRGVVSASGSGGLSLENVSMIGGDCVSDCALAASAVSFSGSGDVAITSSFFSRNGSLLSLFLRVSGTSSLLIENTLMRENTGGLQVRAEGSATVTIRDFEVELAGVDEPATVVVFLDLRDDVSLSTRRVDIHDNLVETGTPVSISLNHQAQAVLEEWTLARNQGSDAGALGLAANDTSVVTIHRLDAMNNTSGVGTASNRGAVDLRAFGGEITWRRGVLRNNFSASSSSFGAAGLGLTVRSAGDFTVERLMLIGNRHVNPDRQATTRQVTLFAQDLGSEGLLRNSLIAESPGRGVDAVAVDDGVLDLTNLTVAGNELGLSFSETNTPGFFSFLISCLFFGNAVDAPDLSGANIFNVGNLVGIDPLFMAPAAGDYRITSGSPAIDSGELGFAGDFDLAGRTRIVSGTFPPGPLLIDVGAYEFQAADIFTDGFESGDVSAWSDQVP